jgi:DNA-binding response OmpR family regulator
MSQKKILIVDDESDILDLLEYNLEKEGYEVIKAMDGEEAIKRAEKEKPDLILLDIMMPKLDGIETCRRIREIPDLQQVYVVFLTARSEEYSELAGFEAGADDYIPKPIKPRVLMSRIRAIMRRDPQSREDNGNRLKIHDLEIIQDEYIVRRVKKFFPSPAKNLNCCTSWPPNRAKCFAGKNSWKKSGGCLCCRPYHRRSCPETERKDRRPLHPNRQRRGVQIPQ